MPTINIPARLRFVLYIVAAVGSAFVVYALDKGWAGESEFKLWLAIAGLLNMLAAVKTNLSDDTVVLTGTVEQTGPAAGDFAATIDAESEH